MKGMVQIACEAHLGTNATQEAEIHYLGGPTPPGKFLHLFEEGIPPPVMYSFSEERLGRSGMPSQRTICKLPERRCVPCDRDKRTMFNIAPDSEV